MFDQAIAAKKGDRSNLDMLADYSVARMEDPVVGGWDPSLDITSCKGRFILEVPPGAQQGIGGARQLEADIEYTAQASADGSGFVYHQKGAELLVAKLAQFNLAPVAYRPPPAIDQPQASAVALQQASAEAAQRASPAPRPPPGPSAPSAPSLEVVAQHRAKPGQTETSLRDQAAGETFSARRSLPNAGGGRNGEETVRTFYNALGSGNGVLASSKVVPEKRSSGAYSPIAISRFYGRLPEPLRLTSIKPLTGNAYHVTYRYSAGRSRCEGSAVVRLVNRKGSDFIRSIESESGC